MIKFLLSLLLIVYAVQCEEEDCPANACEVRKYKCISQDSCNGTLVPGGAACGCCPACLPYLKEGDECTVKEPGSNATSPTVKAECKPEVLTCLSGICVSIY